jgi:hypothetical protein
MAGSGDGGRKRPGRHRTAEWHGAVGAGNSEYGHPIDNGIDPSALAGVGDEGRPNDTQFDGGLQPVPYPGDQLGVVSDSLLFEARWSAEDMAMRAGAADAVQTVLDGTETDDHDIDKLEAVSADAVVRSTRGRWPLALLVVAGVAAGAWYYVTRPEGGNDKNSAPVSAPANPASQAPVKVQLGQ